MERQQQFQQLQNQLLQLGYHQYQLNSIVDDIIGTESFDTLSDDQMDQLLEAMTTYVNFAQKCKTTRLKK